MKRKISILIGIILIVGFFAAAIFVARDSGMKVRSSRAEDLPSEYTLSLEHSGLISPDYTGKIQVKEVRKSKVRNPFSLVVLDQKYNLIIYKIDLSKDNMLRNVISAKHGNVNESAGPLYRSLQVAGLKYKINAAPAKPVDHVFVALAGDSLKVSWLNNECVLYYLVCDKLSIKYGENESNDIFIEGPTIGPTATRQIPMNIMFLRKDQSLYFIVMAPRLPHNTMPPNLLSKVIAWR